MAHSSLTPRCVITGIIVPGHDIHLFCPFEIVQSLVSSHEIRGDRSLFIITADCIPLHHIIAQHTVRHKSAVIHRDPRKCRLIVPQPFTQRIGQHNLIPVINGMSPEFQIPCFVQSFYGSILFPQPDAECLFAILAVAFAAVFIINMPARNMFIASVSLCQLFCKCLRILLIDRRIRARIVSLSEFVMPSLIVCSCNFGIPLHHPCGKRSRGCGKHNVIILPAQHLHNLVQFAEVIDFL